MSGFLARLAARALGQPASAQPRLPGRFEPTDGTETAESALEVVEAEVVAEVPSVTSPGARAHEDPGQPLATLQPVPEIGGRPAAAAARARPIPPPALPSPADRDGSAAIVPSGEESAPPARRRAATRPRPVRGPAAESGAAESQVAMPIGGAATAGDPAPEVGATRDAVSWSDRLVRAVPLAAVTPSIPRTAAEPGGDATAIASAPEPRPVLVHIGRLEVRASLEPAPEPRQPRPVREPAASSVSLADYLRGAR